MNMEVVHGLAAVALAVDNKTGALFAAAQGGSKLLSLEEEPPDKTLVSRLKLHDIPDMPFGNQEKMKRRLGIHIVKGQHFAVFINFFRGNLPGNDLTEYAVAHA
jgi:hypothetical protein